MPYKKSTQKKYGDNPLQKKSAFTLKSGNNIGGRNGNGVNFKAMGNSPVKQTDFISSFTNFLFNTKQTEEGRAIGDLRQRMRHPNIEVRMKAQRENRERLKKIKEKEVEVKKETPPAVVEEKKEEGFKPKYFQEYHDKPSSKQYQYRHVGEDEGGYNIYEFKKPGSDIWKKAGKTKEGTWGGFNAIHDLYESQMDLLSDSPFEKRKMKKK